MKMGAERCRRAGLCEKKAKRENHGTGTLGTGKRGKDLSNRLASDSFRKATWTKGTKGEITIVDLFHVSERYSLVKGRALKKKNANKKGELQLLAHTIPEKRSVGPNKGEEGTQSLLKKKGNSRHLIKGGKKKLRNDLAMNPSISGKARKKKKKLKG